MPVPLAPTMQFKVKFLRDVFAFVGNIIDRRLTMLAAFSALDLQTIVKPLLLVTQYPATRKAEIDFMQGAQEHASDLVIKYLPGRRLKAREMNKASTWRVVCSVLIPVADSKFDTDHTRRWLDQGKSGTSNPGPTKFAFLVLFRMIVGKRAHILPSDE